MAALLRFSPITIFAFVPDRNPAKWIFAVIAARKRFNADLPAG
jgi:hypothetical protein